MTKSTKSVGQRGFTLIELMIVVAIIGILAAVAIPKFADMLRKSKEGATKGSVTNLRSALTIYNSDNEGLAPAMGTRDGEIIDPIAFTTAPIIIPKYVETVPVAKLGTYHNDFANILVRMTTAGVTVDRGITSTDANGWVYTSAGGGSFWVNCTHSDTKNTWITNW